MSDLVLEIIDQYRFWLEGLFILMDFLLEFLFWDEFGLPWGWALGQVTEILG